MCKNSRGICTRYVGVNLCVEAGSMRLHGKLYWSGRSVKCAIVPQRQVQQQEK